MSVEDRYHSIVARLRGWGFDVIEWDGCYGANNGLNWNNGSSPDGHIDHHFVCSLKPDTTYISGLVNMLRNGYGETPGPVVNWFADVLGRAHLIATRPANHSGKGSTAVLQRVKNDQAPNGPAAQLGLSNDFTGNAYYSGTESQHPGDSTPWPDALINVMVAIAAAEAIEFGWSANRIIDHYEHTDRKVDMSYMNGPNSTAGSTHFRELVAARMAGHASAPTATPPAPTPPTPTKPAPPEDDMYSDADRARDVQTAADLAALKTQVAAIAPNVQHTWEWLSDKSTGVAYRVKAIARKLGVGDLPA